tara:strand:+ start:61 stop:288 length:228 start_codon:yes stop_codon:yes gene_type:complete
MTKYLINCIVTSRIPVVPGDEIKYYLNKKKEAQIFATVEGKVMKIGYTKTWPNEETKKITFKIPSCYVIKLLVEC